jgi:glucuronokinase
MVFADFSPFLSSPCSGGESGKVHSSVRALWNEKDPNIVSGMKALGDLTDSAVECLKKPDIPGLAALMERNFALRRHMYGDDVVGKLNIQMADLASTFGLAAKFTGSGGALLCLLRNGQGWCVSTPFHTNCYDDDLPV